MALWADLIFGASGGIPLVTPTVSALPFAVQLTCEAFETRGHLVELVGQDDELTLDGVPLHQLRLVKIDVPHEMLKPVVAFAFSTMRAIVKPS